MGKGQCKNDLSIHIKDHGKKATEENWLPGEEPLGDPVDMENSVAVLESVGQKA